MLLYIYLAKQRPRAIWKEASQLRKTKLEQALEVLVDAKRRGATVGLDPSRIEDPVQLLVTAMNIGRSNALGYLRELEIVDAVVVYKEGVGGQIASARIVKESLAPVFHEEDEDTRCVGALWKHRHLLEKDPSKQVVYSCQFDIVRRDAHLPQGELYNTLHRMEEYKWIRIVRKGRNTKILFVVLSDKFPTPQ